MRRILTTLALAGAAIAGLVFTERRIIRRWRANPDPLNGIPIAFPEGIVRTVTTDDGAAINTVTAGTGPTIVIVHGLTASVADMGPIAAELVRLGFEVIGVDQRGHGASTVGADGFGIPRQAADLAAVLVQLDVRDAIVTGHSMGGMATMTLALDHPELVRERVIGLGLMSTASDLNGPLNRFNLWLGSIPIFDGLARFDDRLRIGAGLLGFGKDPSLFMIEQSLASIARCPAETRRGATAGLLLYDISDRLQSIDMTTLVICGTDDRLTPLKFSEEITAAIETATLEIISDTGHLVIWEEWKGLAERLARFARSAAALGRAVS